MTHSVATVIIYFALENPSFIEYHTLVNANKTGSLFASLIN